MARFFGFDLGDGESAICSLTSEGSYNAKPHAIPVYGEDCFLSVYGRLNSGSMIVLGDTAIEQGMAETLHARFKRNYLNHQQSASSDILVFARAVHDNLIATGQDIDADDVIWGVGCPSSWDEDTRNKYKKIFALAGFKNVMVISESRGAFLFAREGGYCTTEDLQKKIILIIDAGSSTMDMTLVKNLSPVDFGNPKLGAGLIEQELLRINGERNKDIGEALAKYPDWLVRCELHVRKLKEQYFNNKKIGLPVPCTRMLTIPVGNTTISCSDDDMNGILNKKLAELEGYSFLEAYEKCLKNIKDDVSLIILTGGASRMDFIRTMAGDAFPKAKIIQGVAPEFSIAEGLTYALSIDYRLKGFIEEIGG